jgi:hypothetical protein
MTFAPPRLSERAPRLSFERASSQTQARGPSRRTPDRHEAAVVWARAAAVIRSTQWLWLALVTFATGVGIYVGVSFSRPGGFASPTIAIFLLISTASLSATLLAALRDLRGRLSEE